MIIAYHCEIANNKNLIGVVIENTVFTQMGVLAFYID